MTNPPSETSTRTRIHRRDYLTVKRNLRQLLKAQYFRLRHPGVRIVNITPSSQVSTAFSQAGQDAYIMAQFYDILTRNDFPKTFVDVGCNHPTKFSNSFLFEQRLAFRTIAIDPIGRHADSWAALRANAAFVPVAVGAAAGTAILRTTSGVDGGDDMFSTIIPEPEVVKETARHLPHEVKVEVRRLQDVLDEQGIHDVGIMSIDVEGAELEVLAGLDLKRTRINILLLENNSTRFGDETLRLLLRSNGMRFHTRFWGLDDLYVRYDF